MLDNYTEKQIKQFIQGSNQLEEKLGYSIGKHLLNSAGIERFPEAQFDMVRLGIGLYGISAVNANVLRSVATLKTRILQIREVKQDETVGYSRKGVLNRDSRIACLPIGYADGLDRRLGNGNGKILINGKLCPIVGNICMDICMVDITDIKATDRKSVV